jgi:hypothetical protein
VFSVSPHLRERREKERRGKMEGKEDGGGEGEKRGEGLFPAVNEGGREHM